MEIPKELRRFNLERPAPPKNRRLVCTGEGPPKSGKSRFFYETFPEPRLAIDLDLSSDSVIEDHIEDEATLIKRVFIPAKHDKSHDREICDELVELYEAVAAKGQFRSVMIDEGLALYTLCRRAFLDGLDFGDASQQDYTPINSRMSRFFTLAKQNRFNLYIPHRQTKERVQVKSSRTGKWGSQETGDWKYAGWKNALYDSQCHLVFGKETSTTGKRTVTEFTATIKTCVRAKVEGKVLRDEAISLPIVGSLVFPQSEEEDWS